MLKTVVNWYLQLVSMSAEVPHFRSPLLKACAPATLFYQNPLPSCVCPSTPLLSYLLAGRTQPLRPLALSCHSDVGTHPSWIKCWCLGLCAALGNTHKLCSQRIGVGGAWLRGVCFSHLWMQIRKALPLRGSSWTYKCKELCNIWKTAN